MIERATSKEAGNTMTPWWMAPFNDAAVLCHAIIVTLSQAEEKDGGSGSSPSTEKRKMEKLNAEDKAKREVMGLLQKNWLEDSRNGRFRFRTLFNRRLGFVFDIICAGGGVTRTKACNVEIVVGEPVNEVWLEPP